ncbi:unnamed protein product [Adineta steineri]|uniref:Uncharacterized protein n=1 Tax=Adineta steineri TaxID=433720 RepID=A0A819Q886_9BILA|nr:unnamed protein product [Adineta steineri]CAF4020298.1 unnamed protein product [Adineta steineri]
MSSSLAIYRGVAYGVPFGMGAIIFVIMSILNKRAHSYAVERILGIKLKSSKSKTESLETRSSDGRSTEGPVMRITNENSQNNQVKVWSLKQNTETFLYIQQEDEVQKKEKEKEGLPCILRFLCDIFTSAIITVLLEIIFLQCVLSYQSILDNSSCPDFDADCFGTYNGIQNFGPFNCTKNTIANFSVDPPRLSCYGWVYNTTTTLDVINAIGVSGGLLGLVSSIVPLVYYLSYFEKPFRVMSFFGLVPLGWTISTFTVFITHAFQEVSVLTILTFSLLIVMTFGGWGWAVYTSWPRRSRRTDWSCSRKCCGTPRWFLASYPYYPFCCFGKPEKYLCFDV